MVSTDDAAASSAAAGPSNAIAAVAARIQERANALATERAALSLAQAELETATLDRDAEAKKTASVRVDLLAAVRARHGAELELLRLKAASEDVERATLAVRDEENFVRGRAEKVRDEWEDVATNICADHEVRVALHRRREEERIRKREERKRRRERRLDRLALQTDAYQEEASKMHQQRERLREEIRDMDVREEDEDEEIAALAMQIRSTLAKRSSLRTAIENAKDEHKRANENLSRWENELADLLQ